MIAADDLKEQIDPEREEIKLLTRQKIRDMAKHKDNAQVMEETYDALIEEANNRIDALTNQLALVADTTNTIVLVFRVARSVIEIFDNIIEEAICFQYKKGDASSRIAKIFTVKKVLHYFYEDFSCCTRIFRKIHFFYALKPVTAILFVRNK